MGHWWISPRWIVAFFSVVWSIVGIYYYLHQMNLQKQQEEVMSKESLFLQVPKSLRSYISFQEPVKTSSTWSLKCHTASYRKWHYRKEIGSNGNSTIYFETNSSASARPEFVDYLYGFSEDFYEQQRTDSKINEETIWYYSPKGINLIFQNNCKRYSITPWPINVDILGRSLSLWGSLYWWSGLESINYEDLYDSFPFSINGSLLDSHYQIWYNIGISNFWTLQVLSADGETLNRSTGVALSDSNREKVPNERERGFAYFLIPNTRSYIMLEQYGKSQDIEMTYGLLKKTIHIPDDIFKKIPDWYMNTFLTVHHNRSITTFYDNNIPRKASKTWIEIVFWAIMHWSELPIFLNLEPDTWKISEIKYDFN